MVGMEKITLIRLFWICAALTVFVSPSPAANLDDWTTITSAGAIRHLDHFNDSIQVVTSGGWLRIDPISGGVLKTTNVDGLGSNDLRDILQDRDGVIWIAGNGRLIRYDGGECTQYLFFDQDDKLLPLYCLADDGDSLWVGTSIGLALFSKVNDGGQIEDFYYRYGSLSSEPVVRDVLVVGDSIWLATSAGLATADKSDPRLLKSFINWTVFDRTLFPSLVDDDINALCLYHDTITIGTTGGACQLRVDGADTSFFDLAVPGNAGVADMYGEGDSLFLFTSSGVYIHSDGALTAVNTTGIPSSDFSTGRIIDGALWLGLADGGVYAGSDGTYEKIEDFGLPGNYVTSLASSSDGRIGGAFNFDGAAMYDDGIWTTFDVNTRDWVTTMLFDDNDELWMGVWGNGLYHFTDEGAINFDENNSSLRGVIGAPAYVVVLNFNFDGDYLFAANYLAVDGNPVTVLDLTTLQSQSFGLNDDITSDRAITIDAWDDYFVLGTSNNGVYYYYFGPDPFNKSDDSVVNFREENSRLNSNVINVVKYDNDGVFWVGTQFGLLRYDFGVDNFDVIELPLGFGPEVTELAFDRRNNAWIGARNGLARRNVTTGEYEIFTGLNSGLTDDHITALMIDRRSGDVWAGTPSGISIRKSDIGIPTTDIEEVIAFPNPFVVGSGSGTVFFNYDGRADVRIYTVNGELVRTVDVNEGWDGKNRQAQDCASGVYLYHLTDENGSVGRGKLLLVRE